MTSVGEPGDVADLDQQPGRPGGSDAGQVQQAGPGGGDELTEFLVRGLLPGVDPLQISDELRGDPAPGLPGHIALPDLGQQSFGLGCGQVLLRTTRDQLEQQMMQLGQTLV